MADVEEEWTDETTTRERVTSVSRTLTEPTSVAEVAEMARVSKPVARDQLETLEEMGQVTGEEREQTTFYKRDEKEVVYQRIREILEDHSRDDLVDGIRRMKESIREFEERYDVTTPAELANELDPEDADGWEDLTEWRTTAENLAIAKAALSYDDATDVVVP